MSDGDLDRVRAREFPTTGGVIYLNAASWGLIPASAAREAADLLERRNRPDGVVEHELGQAQRRCRSALSRLLAVSEGEIALAPNTSYGVNLAVALVGAGAPGTVVLSDGEFPANVFPWKALERRGFRLEVVPGDEWKRPVEAEMLRRLDAPGVRALALSAVGFASGYRADLRALGSACRERGILFCVDAIQALGAVPLHPEDACVDVLASGGQKWLCAPWGSGFAYVRKALQARFDPPMVSWLAVEGATDFEDMLHYTMDWLGDARKFELATLGIQDYVGLARCVEIFLEVGVESVARYLHHIQAPVLDWMNARPDVVAVTPTDPAYRAGILSFSLPALDKAARALRTAGVVFGVREGAIRLAPHFYNTRQEMEEVVRILEA